MEWIFNNFFLDNQNVLFIISVILVIVMTIIPFILAKKIMNK